MSFEKAPLILTRGRFLFDTVAMRLTEELPEDAIDRLILTYRDGLLKDTLPFWIRNCVDLEYGGFMFCLDRDGSLVDTDKGMWQTCRFTWLLSTLAEEVEARVEWLDLAGHGIHFINRYGFDHDGRMFFTVSREGSPLRKRRYLFTEFFAAMALAAYARATGDTKSADKAADLFELITLHLTNSELTHPKIDPATRPSKGLAIPMIMICTARELFKTLGEAKYQGYIKAAINEINDDFFRPEISAVLETVGPAGEFLDHFDGRLIVPGHAIEAAWFIMQEGAEQGNSNRISLGIEMLELMLERGWDPDYGGLLYFVDVNGLPVQEYWHDMKFWWPHTEAMVATLLAYCLTGSKKYLRWHWQVHDWAMKHFPDPEFGEWFGYLHRDGSLSSRIKGNIWKGPFHLPRMQLRCWKMLESIKKAENQA